MVINQKMIIQMVVNLTMTRQRKNSSEEGAVLISVLLLAVLISILIAASMLMLNVPEKLYEDNLNQTQAYYDAQAGVVEGGHMINSFVKNIDVGNWPPWTWHFSSNSPYPLGQESGSVTVTVWPASPPKSGTQATLVFQISSTGTSTDANGNKATVTLSPPIAPVSVKIP